MTASIVAFPLRVRDDPRVKASAFDDVMGCPFCNTGHMFHYRDGRNQCVTCLAFIYWPEGDERPGDDVSGRVK